MLHPFTLHAKKIDTNQGLLVIRWPYTKYFLIITIYDVQCNISITRQWIFMLLVSKFCFFLCPLILFNSRKTSRLNFWPQCPHSEHMPIFQNSHPEWPNGSFLVTLLDTCVKQIMITGQFKAFLPIITSMLTRFKNTLEGIARLSDAPSNIGLSAKTVIPPSQRKKKQKMRGKKIYKEPYS